ncbi:MAG: winged helix-turn-helix transcriptional regulator [Burkholderiaceae bacterium]
MYIDGLVKICEKAWAITILAQIATGVPVRVSVLAAAAGTTRSAIRPSIAHLHELGLLVENAGHGHPLRPESVLTPAGERWAELALQLRRELNNDEERRLIRFNWTLPTLRVAHEPVRFSALRQTLPPIGDSALSTTLQRLETTGWIERQIDLAIRPPRVAYITVNRGREIGNLLTDSVSL